MAHRPTKRTARARSTALLLATVMLVVPPASAQLRPIEPLDAAGRITYFVAEGENGSLYRPSDRELAIWALEAWARATGGRIRFEPAPRETALVQVHWVAADNGQYGEMRPLSVAGRRGAAVYIRPDTSALGPDIAKLAASDPLVRETIVYLTCLHELGHALGLDHTDSYADIMYAFGFGGDIPGYFMRYRRQLTTRADIAKVSGVSAGDVETVRGLYGG